MIQLFPSCDLNAAKSVQSLCETHVYIYIYIYGSRFYHPVPNKPRPRSKTSLYPISTGEIPRPVLGPDGQIPIKKTWVLLPNRGPGTWGGLSQTIAKPEWIPRSWNSSHIASYSQDNGSTSPKRANPKQISGMPSIDLDRLPTYSPSFGSFGVKPIKISRKIGCLRIQWLWTYVFFGPHMLGHPSFADESIEVQNGFAKYATWVSEVNWSSTHSNVYGYRLD